MPNNPHAVDNLHIIKTHKEAVRKGRAGGKKTSLLKKLARRTKCNERCPFWERCNMKYIAQTQYGGKCALKMMPKKVQQRTLKLISGGEEGFNDFILELMSDVNNEAIMNKTSKERLIKLALDVKKSLYGEKKQIELNSDEAITINDIKKVLEEINGSKETDK